MIKVLVSLGFLMTLMTKYFTQDNAVYSESSIGNSHNELRYHVKVEIGRQACHHSENGHDNNGYLCSFLSSNPETNEIKLGSKSHYYT